MFYKTSASIPQPSEEQNYDNPLNKGIFNSNLTGIFILIAFAVRYLNGNIRRAFACCFNVSVFIDCDDLFV